MNDLHLCFESELKKFRSEIDKVKTPEALMGDDEDGMGRFVHRFDLFEATIKNEVHRLKTQVNTLKMETENIKTLFR